MTHDDTLWIEITGFWDMYETTKGISLKKYNFAENGFSENKVKEELEKESIYFYS